MILWFYKFLILKRQILRRTHVNIRLSRRRGVTTKLVNGSTIATNVRYIDDFYTVYHENCHRIGLRSWSRKEIEMMFNALRENLFVLYAYLNCSSRFLS